MQDAKADDEGSVKQFLWIGDSRTEGMELYVKTDVYCAAESADFKWLTGEGEAMVEDFLTFYQGTTVLLNLGINDLKDGSKYIRFYRSLMRRYPEKNFYVMSLGPVNEETEANYGYTVTNAQVEEINDQFRKAFPLQYLDIYHWLREKGFASNDGVHYTPQECRGISSYVHLKIGIFQMMHWLREHGSYLKGDKRLRRFRY